MQCGDVRRRSLPPSGQFRLNQEPARPNLFAPACLPSPVACRSICHPHRPPPPPFSGKRRGVWAILIFQIPFLYGLAVTYTVTGGQNMGSFIALAQVRAC